MKKLVLGLLLVLGGLWPCVEQLLRSAPEQRPEPHRSPIDVALLPGGRLALTANHTSDSVSFLDLDGGKVLAELPCGHKPAAVACSSDGRRAAVSNLWSGTLTLLEIQGTTLRPAGTVSVGATHPRSLVFAPDGNSIYVALAGADEVVRLDWQTRKVLSRYPAGGEPRRLALTRDGHCLAAASGRSAQVRCWDTNTGKELWERTILGAFNLFGLAFSADEKDLIAPLVHDRAHSISKRNIEEGWALDNRLCRLTRQPEPQTEYWQIALDLRGEAVADPYAVAASGKGDWLAVTASGSHELVLIKPAAIPWSPLEPGDVLDSTLAVNPDRFRRVPLEGRPMGVQFGDNGQVVVANYLLDAVQVVDAQAGKLVRTIRLGAPAKPSLARQGEAIYHDAKRSHHQWFSCNTCHPDGHTCGRTFDTLNDDSDGNPKLTPSLRGVTRTGPWTWHGVQPDLGQAIEKSLTQTLFGPKPSAEDVRAVLAFLGTLDHPPNPNRLPSTRPHGQVGELSASARRGQELFQGKARCVRCHQGEDFTSPKVYNVKIEGDGSPFDLWNPPSLRGLHDRGPFLHDGRAATLEDVLRSVHSPEKLGGAALTAEEKRDLISFLKSL